MDYDGLLSIFASEMENRQALISVVVPVYNRAGVVTRTLDSIVAQQSKSFELIVIDNGSTDGTAEVVEQWRRTNSGALDIKTAVCLRKGAAAARNHGLEMACGQWVLFFDSDDTMPPTHLGLVADAIAANPDADIIGWDTVQIHRDGSRSSGDFYGRAMQKHNLFDGSMATQRWCARTAFVRECGGWNEEVRVWNDIELGARMLSHRPCVRYIGASGVTVYESDVSITSVGAADPTLYEPALRSIEKSLGAKGRRWCRLKRAITYGLLSRRGTADCRQLMNSMKPGALLWAAYHYTRLGGRGAGRLCVL